ncbi:MAG: superoxide dismutase family protein [Candidatus Rokuibacteriota bacterium]
MKRLGAVAALSALAAACATVGGGAPETARAELKNPGGLTVGTATFTEVSGGVRVVLEARGLPAGARAVHVHDVGRCEPPGFNSAGGHFNPGKRQHGILNPAGPHAGDLPNLTVGPDGTGRLETTTDRFTLGAGPTSVFDTDGSALVVHAAPDDFRTDPTGNSGGRAACGVIVGD